MLRTEILKDLVMNQKIVSYLQSCIKDRVFPGCVMGTIADGTSDVSTLGNFTYDVSSPIVREDTIYDVASITKAIPTACLALRLVEKGMIGLDTPCEGLLPELAGQYRSMILIRHLLTHTLDFDLRLSQKKDLSPSDILKELFSARLKTPPGSAYAYANATSILLGLAVERVTGKSLDVLAEECFFSPLGMKSTVFFPDEVSEEQIAPTEIDPWRGREIRGEVHDESAWALRSAMVAGSAGLFSNVPDLLVFLAMLLNKGEYDGVRYFAPETVALMHRNALPPTLGVSTAFGWELNNEHFMGANRTPSTFGKTGFTGCTIIADPSKNAGFVFLTNHTYPRRRAEKETINRVRNRLAEMVL